MYCSGKAFLHVGGIMLAINENLTSVNLTDPVYNNSQNMEIISSNKNH